MSEKKSNVPKLRFPGFTEPWEQRKLGDIVDFLDDRRKPLDSGKRERGIYPYYGASGIIDYVKDYLFDEELVLLSEDGANILTRNYRVSFLASGKYWVNNHAHVLRAKEKYVNGFICEILESIDYTRFNSGTAQPKLTKETCQKILLTFPSFLEQKEIYQFLEQLSNLITLHQRKLEHVKKLKAGLLQKMFPKEGESIPEVRFPGFTDPWEQRKLGEIADVVDGDRGINYPSSNDFNNYGHTLFLNANNITSNGFSFNNNQFITEDKSNSMGNGRVQLNDIVLTSRGSLGHVALYDKKIGEKYPYVRINSGMLILRCNSEFHTSFILQRLKSSLGQRQIKLISFGSAQPQLTKKDVSAYLLFAPEKFLEQKKIGEFFNHIDVLVTLHQRKLEHLNDLKKGLLQQMFV